jgi:hypothetical protein
MELVNLWKKMWWSIYICGRHSSASLHQAAAGSSEQQQHLLQDLFHIHGLFHLLSGYKTACSRRQLTMNEGE